MKLDTNVYKKTQIKFILDRVNVCLAQKERLDEHYTWPSGQLY